MPSSLVGRAKFINMLLPGTVIQGICQIWGKEMSAVSQELPDGLESASFTLQSSKCVVHAHV